MGICNILQDLGAPPENCTLLRSWLKTLVDTLATTNQIKCAEDTADPADQDLTDLWNCDVPEGAFVIWYNSVSGDTLYHVYIGGDWIEVTLT